MSKEREGGSDILLQALFYLITDHNFNTDSYIKYQNGYHLTRDAMMWFWGNYLDNQTTNPSDPLVSPLQASVEQLTGLPPTVLITDENYVLRDEGEAYAHKIMDASYLLLLLDILEQFMTL